MNTKITIPDTWLKHDFNKWIEKMSNEPENLSCCGDEVEGTLYEDIGICPTCKEHI